MNADLLRYGLNIGASACAYACAFLLWGCAQSSSPGVAPVAVDVPGGHQTAGDVAVSEPPAALRRGAQLAGCGGVALLDRRIVVTDCVGARVYAEGATEVVSAVLAQWEEALHVTPPVLMYDAASKARIAVAVSHPLGCTISTYSSAGLPTWSRSLDGDRCVGLARGGGTLAVAVAGPAPRLLFLDEDDGLPLGDASLGSWPTTAPVVAPSTDPLANGGSHWLVGVQGGVHIVDAALGGVVASLEVVGEPRAIAVLPWGFTAVTTAAPGALPDVVGDRIYRLAVDQDSIGAVAEPLLLQQPTLSTPVAAEPCATAEPGSTWWCADGAIVAGGSGWITTWPLLADSPVSIAVEEEAVATALALGDDGWIHVGGMLENGGSHWIVGRASPAAWHLVLEDHEDAYVSDGLVTGTSEFVASVVHDRGAPSRLVRVDTPSPRHARGWARARGDAANAGTPIVGNRVCAGSARSLWSTSPASGAGAQLEAVALHPTVGRIAAGTTLQGSDSEVVVYAVDESGEVRWTRTLGTEGVDSVCTVAVDQAGLIRVFGRSSAHDWLGDGVIHQLSLQGTVVDSRLYGQPGFDQFNDATAADAGWALVGSRRQDGAKRGWFLLIDEAEEAVVDRTFANTYWANATSISSAPGGYYVGGAWAETADADPRGAVWRFDGAGEEVWKAKVGESLRNVLYDVVTHPNGGVLAVGLKTPSPAGDMGWVVRVDESGTLVADYEIDIPELLVVVPAPDGGYDVLGEGPRAGRLDEEGRPGEVTQMLPGTFALIRDAARLPDGGLFAAGEQFSSGGETPLMLQTTAWGHASCEKAGACAHVSPSACDDTDPCTVDSCAPANGACKHTQVPNCTAQ